MTHSEQTYSGSSDPVDRCDGCGAALAYPGNNHAGSTYCDSCYSAWSAGAP